MASITTVPAILKYLSENSNYNNNDQNVEYRQRAKKRRLDHLSWEEKMQRKKLKNRVAAQTSRDRKKAKMDEMEHAIQELFAKNESLIEEVQNLKALNERLLADSQSQHRPCAACDHRNRPVEYHYWIDRIPPSTERSNDHTFSSESGGSGAQQRSAVEDCHGLPSLPDLLDELDTDVDLASLELLTQSLLHDIAKDLEAAAAKTDLQEPNSAEEVVGPPPEQLESSRTESLADEIDISEYLLLHHNYSAKPKQRQQRPIRRRAVKRVRPARILPKTSVPSMVVEEEQKKENEIMFGTFDEHTQCITIIVNDGTSPVIDGDVAQGVGLLEVPKGGASPCSDCGYESLGSPLEGDWSDSVSELFPSLM